TCRRPGRARSCAGSCGTSPRAASSGTRRPSPIQRSSSSSARTASSPRIERVERGPVPLNFLRRKKAEAPVGPSASMPAAATRPARTGVAFDGITEEWRLVGRMDVEGRLSDALNKRESIAIHDVQWAQIDGSAPLVQAPGLKSVDPYDLILVL